MRNDKLQDFLERVFIVNIILLAISTIGFFATLSFSLIYEVS